MAYQKILGQTTRSLEVIPSDYCDIPYPGNIVIPTGTPSGKWVSDNPGSGVVSVLADSNQLFITNGIEVGDIIYNISTRGGGIITQIISETSVKVSGGLDFSGVSQTYYLYKKGDYPCMLFIGVPYMTTPMLGLTSAGGDFIESIGGAGAYSFNTLNTWNLNFYFPFQVRKLWETAKSGTIDNSGIKTIATW